MKITKSFIKQIIMEELGKLNEASDPVITKQNLIKKGFTAADADKYNEYQTALSNLKNPTSGNYDAPQKNTLIGLYNSLPLKVKNLFSPPE